MRKEQRLICCASLQQAAICLSFVILISHKPRAPRAPGQRDVYFAVSLCQITGAGRYDDFEAT